MMRKIKKTARFFTLNVKLTFDTLSSYKAATILTFCTNIFIVLIYLFLWKGIYGEQTIVNGYTLKELLLFIILLRVLRRSYPFHISKTYGQLIKNGTIATWLLKPIPIELRLLSQAIGQTIYQFCFSGLPMLLLVPLFANVPNFTFFSVALFLLWYISAFIFLYIFEIIIGVISYYTSSLWGVGNFKSAIITFLSGELLPLSFYPVALLGFLEILPFSAVYYMPISILLSKVVENTWIIFSILWLSIILLLGLYLSVSQIMIKRITVQGG